MTFVPEVDRWISAEFTRLAEIIRDYSYSNNCDLELRWIPPEHRSDPEDKKKPYCIWDNDRKHVVMFASELDNPVDILAKLFNIDNKNGNVLDKMLAHNKAIEAMRLKEQLDQQEAAIDLAAFALGNTKSSWWHAGRKFDDEFREIPESKPKVIE